MDPPEDPGGTPIEIAHYVTVSNNDTSVDTDGSVTLNSSKRKRISARPIICKHCNKKRRKNGGKKQSDCNCVVEMETTIISPSDPLISQTPKVNNSVQDNKVSPQSLQSVTRLMYNASDAAPFIIHVQREQSSDNDNVFLNPISFGRFLKRNSFNNIINGSLKKIGRNRLVLSFSQYKDANTFLTSKYLETEKYKAFIPSFSVTRMGVVRGIPSEWSDEDIKENISVPIGCGNILKIRRIKRKISNEGKTEYKNTETVILTFDGQVLPKRVFMCYTALSVDLYIYPTIQCYNCCRYGHVKNMCRSKPRCYKCGQDHNGVSCAVSEEDVSCCLCKGYHEATSRKCLEFERQKSIKESMAKSCISYAEASKLHPTISKVSYADALLSSPKVPSHMSASIPQDYSTSKQNKTSYKKTVFIKPRSPPSPSKGYDQQFHQSLARDSRIPDPKDGCAISSNDSLSSLSINDLIIALINSLSQSNLISPSIAAPVYNAVYKYSNNNNGQSIQGIPMELPKCNI